ncbi:MAG: tetratricopeptide repeat protein, partial [Myxococcota bacterium]
MTEDYFAAQEDYDKALKEYQDGKRKVKPVEPQKKFDMVVAMYRRLVNDYPSYKLIDAVYYLLGYALAEQGLGKESAEAFTALITKFPKSKYVTESW